MKEWARMEIVYKGRKEGASSRRREEARVCSSSKQPRRRLPTFWKITFLCCNACSFLYVRYRVKNLHITFLCLFFPSLYLLFCQSLIPPMKNWEREVWWGFQKQKNVQLIHKHWEADIRELLKGRRQQQKMFTLQLIWRRVFVDFN